MLILTFDTRIKLSEAKQTHPGPARFRQPAPRRRGTDRNRPMTKLFAALQARSLRLAADKKGVTALEYGLIGALIAGIIIAAVGTLGGGITNTFGDIANALITARP